MGWARHAVESGRRFGESLSERSRRRYLPIQCRQEFAFSALRMGLQPALRHTDPLPTIMEPEHSTANWEGLARVRELPGKQHGPPLGQSVAQSCCLQPRTFLHHQRRALYPVLVTRE